MELKFWKIYEADIGRQFNESGDFPIEDQYMNASKGSSSFFLFSNPSTPAVSHINRSVLMAGILNEILFMVVWRIHSLYPLSYH